MQEYPLLFIPTEPELKRYKGNGRGDTKYPLRTPRDHAAHIQALFTAAWAENTRSTEQSVLPLPAKKGVYLQVKGAAGKDLATKSLDSSRGDYTLLNVKQLVENDAQTTVATIFIPNEKKEQFTKKIQSYATELTATGKPKNNDLISGIEEIHLALLDDFWTDAPAEMPREMPQWCELWLKDNETFEAVRRFEQYAQALQIEYSKTSRLSFPERTIVLAKLNSEAFHKLLQISSDIAECRLAREPAEFFLDLSPRDQADWASALLENTRFDTTPVSICILDTGVNNGHSLLAPVLQNEDMHTVCPDWGINDHHGHGTGMAGIATYGNLTRALASTGQLTILHCLESCKIRPPQDDLPQELYGFVTANAVQQARDAAPERKRQVCMAVSAPSPFADKGEPTSWSAAIDRLAAGVGDDTKYLVLLSAGNVRNSEDWANYPDSNLAMSVEDPAQSWNALTVGAFTNFTQLGNQADDPVAVAPQGGLSPLSRTSCKWAPQRPPKPDVVFEGGNIARSADGFCCTHDALSVLTTSSQMQRRLFANFDATSAATAEAAWFAAQLQLGYPEAWPETIRALMVHSAEWTSAMREQFAPGASKTEIAKLKRICGHGVPSLQRAMRCLNNSLVLVAEREFMPFRYFDESVNKLAEGMQLHMFDLPWPKDALQDLAETPVTLRITLSYFIEPSPGQRGWDSKYRYASHGLRFEVCGPHESFEDFEKRINRAAREEEEGVPAPSSDAALSKRWGIGRNGRNSGSVHSDYWEGTGAEIAVCNRVAVFPVGGWWKTRTHLKKADSLARYSLIISLHTEAQDVDIYTPVKVAIDNQIQIPVAISV